MDTAYIKTQAEALFGIMLEARRYLHMHPETGGNEFGTQKYIMDFLSREGIENHKCADTGVVAVVRGSKPGCKTVALRGDIDALPMLEKSDREYKSRNEGATHACGHDAHTAINLGGAKFFNDNRDKFAGTMKFFFQPAEESFGGAERMINEGCMENPRVDYVLGLHMDPELGYDSVGFTRGTFNAAIDMANITIRGKGGHGAYPHDCVDSIVIAAQAITVAQTIVSREISPVRGAVFSVGKINGGTAQNIIAGEVKLVTTIRSSSPEIREHMHKRITEIFTGVAAAMRGSAEVEIIKGYPALEQDDGILHIVEESAEELFGPEKLFYNNEISMGGEDFAFFTKAVPGAFYNVGCRVPGRENYPLHAVDFDIDERCLVTGLATQALTAVKLLGRA